MLKDTPSMRLSVQHRHVKVVSGHVEKEREREMFSYVTYIIPQQ